MSDEAQSRKQRKLRAAARLASVILPVHLPPVLFLTDPRRTPNPAATAASLPPGWGVVYRHFGDEARYRKAEELAVVCRRRNLALLIAADPDLAMAVGADGVHWPESRAGEARRWAGRFTLMTASAHSRAGLSQLERLPLDAVLRSTVFPSASASAGPAMESIRFRFATQRAALPVYALGGVSAETVSRIAGVSGLAAIDGVSEAFGS